MARWGALRLADVEWVLRRVYECGGRREHRSAGDRRIHDDWARDRERLGDRWVDGRLRVDRRHVAVEWWGPGHRVFVFVFVFDRRRGGVWRGFALRSRLR